MSYQVSDENMKKMQMYFVKKIKETGTNRIEATVVEIADGAEVALATAHKALKQMAKENKLTIIKPSSRRFPITYVYNEDIQGFEETQNKDEQIEYLQNLVAELNEKVARLEQENYEMSRENKRLERQLENCLVMQ
jgi:hypothetical protein